MTGAQARPARLVEGDPMTTPGEVNAQRAQVRAERGEHGDDNAEIVLRGRLELDIKDHATLEVPLDAKDAQDLAVLLEPYITRIQKAKGAEPDDGPVRR